MRTMFLIRHGKSSWGDSTLADRDRPLDPRGERDAADMGRRLAVQGVMPDLLVSSPATRARTTAEIIANKLDYKRSRIVLDERLYAAQASDILKVIHTLDPHVKTVLIFGHNPAFTELARQFAPETAELPTCAVVELRFRGKDWAQVGAATLEHLELDYPKKAEDRSA